MQKKKSLGQHFLRTASYLAAIADALDIKKGETVVEIGPGEGALTEHLLARGARVIAIEKDARLIEFLREKFEGKKFEVIEGDALVFDPPQTYKLVGNIPYYITGALFKKFLSAKRQPSRLVFLVQKEVAERIARAKKESILSLSIKAYGTPLYIKKVPAGAFVPRPQVDSAIIAVNDISREKFSSAAHEARFFDAVKRGFAQKRKLLKNNLGEKFARAFATSHLSATSRAEDVPLSKWIGLSQPSES